MPIQVVCKICGKRRARRTCPAVEGDICALCCGTEREVSLSCPLDCQYLKEAHEHEKVVPLAQEQISYPDIQVTEEFLRDHEELLMFSMYSLVEAALKTAGAIDVDIMAALEALIQTQRTLASGLVYETRAANMIAVAVQRAFTDAIANYQKAKEEGGTVSAFRGSDLLLILVFLHRVGQQNQNGRPRGRMFLDLLRAMSPATRVEERAPSIIL